MENLSNYVDLILKSSFPQSYFCSADRFTAFLKNIGLDINEGKLEYLDKIGIAKPVLKLTRPKTSESFPKYATVFEDVFTMKDQYYKGGFLELYDKYDPWKNNKDGLEEKIILYYHPFQFLPLRRLMMGLSFRIDGQFIEQVQSIEESFKSMKERISVYEEASKKSNEEFWIPRIGLLMLLEESYGPYVKAFRSNPYVDSNAYYNEWIKWRNGVFNPNSILKRCNLSIHEAKEFYDGVATEGEWMDPLSKWYVFQRIVKDSMLFQLKNNALYAQYCYNLSSMLYHFIYDLTGEKMYDPDDIMDGNNHGEWKKEIYGYPFDYTTTKTQKRILDTFLINRPFRAGIIFEGETEQVVIESILNSLRINKKIDGFFLYNAKGQSNIVSNLKGLYAISRMEDIELFLIVDNDNEAKQIQDELKMYIKHGNVKIWEGDFEYDNFGVDALSNELNVMLESKGYEPITREKIMEQITASNKVLMNIIGTIFREQNKMKLSDVISKKTLGENLIHGRIEEIGTERFSGGWKPKLPIEIVLNEIFHKIPKHSFSFQFGC